MFTWVMGGRVSGMRPILNSPITINHLYNILKIRVAGILRPKSTSSIFNTYTTPIITITTTYITPITTITTYTTPLIAMTTIS